MSEEFGIWSAVWLVIVTINAWLAFYLDGPAPEAAAAFTIMVEGVYTFAGFLRAMDFPDFDEQRSNITRCIVAGLLGVEAALLVLMFYIPPPAQTDPLVISFFVFALSWMGFAWETV